MSLYVCVTLLCMPLPRHCNYHLQWSSFLILGISDKTTFFLISFHICFLYQNNFVVWFRYCLFSRPLNNFYLIILLFDRNLLFNTHCLQSSAIIPSLSYSHPFKYYFSKVFSEQFHPNGLLLSDWALFSPYVRISVKLLFPFIFSILAGHLCLVEMQRKWNLFQGVLAFF